MNPSRKPSGPGGPRNPGGPGGPRPWRSGKKFGKPASPKPNRHPRPHSALPPGQTLGRSSASPARTTAFEILHRFEQPQAAPLDDLLLEARAATPLSSADWRLCHQIAQGTTRHRDFLDWVLADHLKAGGRTTSMDLRIALRMAVFQHLFLDRVPPHAIVKETVELARAAGCSEKAAGFVNAVARRIVARDPAAELDLPPNAARADVLRRFSIPHWIGRILEHTYGRRQFRAECEALALPAPLDFRINTLQGDAEAIRTRAGEEIAHALAERNAPPPASSPEAKGESPDAPSPAAEWIVAGRYAPETIRVRRGLDFTTLPVFREGLITPQDEAATLVAYWVDPKPGWSVGDFCAAPGGKAAHLAALMENRGHVHALDIDPARLARLEETRARLGATCLHVASNTAAVRAQWNTPGATGLDAALVDPPCTTLGTIRRHPDVKWRYRAADARAFAEKQRAILEEAAACVRPGGILVYSVCTITKKETFDVIDGFLADHPEWCRDTDFVPPAFVPAEWRTDAGDYRTSTARDALDGFFIARLRRLAPEEPARERAEQSHDSIPRIEPD